MNPSEKPSYLERNTENYTQWLKSREEEQLKL
jgi:hypothetical protein